MLSSIVVYFGELFCVQCTIQGVPRNMTVEYLLPHTVFLDIKDFMQFIQLNIFLFYKLWKMTFKTFYQLSCFVGHLVQTSNYHVSWDTLCIQTIFMFRGTLYIEATVMFRGTPCTYKQLSCFVEHPVHTSNCHVSWDTLYIEATVMFRGTPCTYKQL